MQALYLTRRASVSKLTGMKIDGMTKSYGIIGWPVKHSLSPRFQMHFLQQARCNAAYLPFAVAPDLLAPAMEGLWALGVQGFNVTVPHKESVFQMVDADADARLIGAVNTVRRAESGWQATNTDWLGFKAVIDGLNVDIEGRQVLLFGAGGTARAALRALADLRPGAVHICNRSSERLAALLASARDAYPELNCQPLSWRQSEVREVSADSSLLMNTTTIGLNTNQDFPFVLNGSGAAIDAVYQPDGATAFVRAAMASGRRSVDGLPMLIAQGAASFAWWHDCDSPDCNRTLDYMQQSLGRDRVGLPGWKEGA